MQGTGLFPVMVMQMSSIGEESGSLDHMLGKAADFYESEVDEAVAGLSALMEPFIIVFLGHFDRWHRCLDVLANFQTRSSGFKQCSWEWWYSPWALGILAFVSAVFERGCSSIAENLGPAMERRSSRNTHIQRRSGFDRRHRSSRGQVARGSRSSAVGRIAEVATLWLGIAPVCMPGLRPSIGPGMRTCHCWVGCACVGAARHAGQRSARAIRSSN